MWPVSGRTEINRVVSTKSFKPRLEKILLNHFYACKNTTQIPTFKLHTLHSVRWDCGFWPRSEGAATSAQATYGWCKFCQGLGTCPFQRGHRAAESYVEAGTTAHHPSRHQNHRHLRTSLTIELLQLAGPGPLTRCRIIKLFSQATCARSMPAYPAAETSMCVGTNDTWHTQQLDRLPN